MTIRRASTTVLTLLLISAAACTPRPAPVAPPSAAAASILEREKDGPLLKAAHDEISVPISEGLPMVLVFPKPLFRALRSSCLPLSVGHSRHVLSVRLEKQLPVKVPLLWVELEDHSLYAIRLVGATRKIPAQARIDISPGSLSTPPGSTQKPCCS
jgi:hypothetical protein